MSDSVAVWVFLAGMVIGALLVWWALHLGKAEPSSLQIEYGAHRFATAAAALNHSTIQKKFPQLSAKELVESWNWYRAIMIDAYTTGAVEALKMRRGDYTPEPWR